MHVNRKILFEIFYAGRIAKNFFWRATKRNKRIVEVYEK